MKKLKIKYNNNKLFNIGNVLKVYYVVFLRKKKRVYSFVGFCFFKNKSSFKLVNVIKRQNIIMTLSESSPFIIKIFNLKMYRIYIKRVTKLYFKIGGYYQDQYNTLENSIVSNIRSFKARFFRQAYFSRKKIRRPRIKKLKLKFMRAESWFDYLNLKFDSLDYFDLNYFFLNFVDSSINVNYMEKMYFFNINLLSEYDEYDDFEEYFNDLNELYSNLFSDPVYTETYDEAFDDIYEITSTGDKILSSNKWLYSSIL